MSCSQLEKLGHLKFAVGLGRGWDAENCYDWQNLNLAWIRDDIMATTNLSSAMSNKSLTQKKRLVTRARVADDCAIILPSVGGHLQ